MKTQRFSIINDDAFYRIKEIKDNSIDLILTDPPYNIGKYSKGDIKFNWRSDINNKIADWDQGQFNPSMISDEFVRILKPSGNIFIFCSYNLIGEWHRLLDDKFDTTQFMIWHKTNPTPNFFKTSFLNSCEMIFCAWNKGHCWNFSTQKEMHNFFESPICSGKERLRNPKHPTQKPLKILEHIIKIASNENSLVFDPFMGVGSVGEAALRLRRRFVGIEIEEQYYKAAENRILNCNDI
ncbi:site-specific DNA-methyltransferase [Haemophilus haemoglobinophilus]|nr:site-specific DNA-methyltransferase [Canicola haemoglobinophilus]MBN6712240.1 site-specific DNA-methyltransferase [Canicola haemoglobinophilus]